jgi:hypothetical protein
VSPRVVGALRREPSGVAHGPLGCAEYHGLGRPGHQGDDKITGVRVDPLGVPDFLAREFGGVLEYRDPAGEVVAGQLAAQAGFQLTDIDEEIHPEPSAN